MASERISVETHRVGDVNEQTIRRLEPDGNEAVETATYPRLHALFDPTQFASAFGSDVGHEMHLPERGRKDHR